MHHHFPQPIIHQLDEKLASALAEMRTLPGWRALVAKRGGEVEPLPPQLVRMAGLAELCAFEVDQLLLDQMAQLSASMPTRLLCSLFEHEPTSDRLAASVVSANSLVNEVLEQWKRILAMEDPFAVMGACYLCKSLWPRWAKVMADDLKALKLPAEVREAVAQREKIQRKNTALVRALIEDIHEQYPQTESSILAGFDALMDVYPLRFWSALVQEADPVSEWQSEEADQMRVG